MWKSNFEPQQLESMSAAFEVAWDFIEKTSRYQFVDKDAAREELAEIVMHFAQTGELNKLKLANLSIAKMRQRIDAHSPARAPRPIGIY
jgi:hypothetical protein